MRVMAISFLFLLELSNGLDSFLYFIRLDIHVQCCLLGYKTVAEASLNCILEGHPLVYVSYVLIVECHFYIVAPISSR